MKMRIKTKQSKLDHKYWQNVTACSTINWFFEKLLLWFKSSIRRKNITRTVSDFMAMLSKCMVTIIHQSHPETYLCISNVFLWLTFKVQNLKENQTNYRLGSRPLLFDSALAYLYLSQKAAVWRISLLVNQGKPRI